MTDLHSVTAADQRDGVVEAVADLLGALGVDEGDHTADTPARVARAWHELLSGYRENPADHLDRTFSAPTDPGLVIVSGVRLVSTCAHHLLPFVGTATIAYRPSPGQKVVGLSKLARVLQGYAARLQVQEQIGAQVVEAIVDRLNPSGACVIITATHQCMTIRGAGEPEAATTTQAAHGMVTDSEMSLIMQSHREARR